MSEEYALLTETSGPDPMMVRIGEGIELSQRGEREAARCVFADLWNEIGPSGDPTAAPWRMGWPTSRTT